VVVGGFLIIDFATRTHWKKGYDDIKQQLDIARQNANTSGETMARDVSAVRKFKAERDDAQQKLVAEQEERKAMESAHQVQNLELEKRLVEADLIRDKIGAENVRLTGEVKTQLDVIKQRDDVIVKQTKDVINYRNYAVQQENDRKATQDRLEQALVQLQEVTAALQKATAGAAAERVAKGGAAAKHNPPSVYAEGKVEAVDKNLAKVTVGTDKGVNKGHTLEVFRMDPQPMYLGVLHIIDSQPHSAVGRFERATGADRGPLRPGDTVASSLSR
jgi:hypothetical protein